MDFNEALKFEFSIEEVIKNGDITAENLAEFKKWVEVEKKVPSVPDHFLVLFLFSRDNNLKAAKKALEMYFKCIQNDPDGLFVNRDLNLPELKQVVDDAAYGIFALTEDCDVFVYSKLKNTDPSVYHVIPSMKIVLMAIFLIRNFKYPPRNIKVVVDAQGFGFWHLIKCKPSIGKRCITFIQEAAPIRISELHIVNSFTFAKQLYFLLKPFVKEEHYKKIHFHYPDADMVEFSKTYNIPLKYLPTDIGGELCLERETQKSIEQLKALTPFLNAEEALRNSFNIESESGSESE